MDDSEMMELYKRSGRTPILIDFSTGYMEEGNWKVNTEKPNGWSSRVRINSDWHLPCFDVDIHPDMHRWGRDPRWGEPEDDKPHPYPVRHYVEQLFPDAQWMPSSTEGHYHVYSDTPMHWDTYHARLVNLTILRIVEWGYRDACVSRRGSHVRQQGVKKEIVKPRKVYPRHSRTTIHRAIYPQDGGMYMMSFLSFDKKVLRDFMCPRMKKYTHKMIRSADDVHNRPAREQEAGPFTRAVPAPPVEVLEPV